MISNKIYHIIRNLSFKGGGEVPAFSGRYFSLMILFSVTIGPNFLTV